MEEAIDSCQPKPAGLKSPTVIGLQLAAWLVFVCLWLPLCRGCSGGGTKIPVQSLKPLSLNNAQEMLFNFLLLGSYCNGLFVAFSICVAAWLLSERIWKLFFFGQYSVTLGLCIVLAVIALLQCPDRKTFVSTVLAQMPLVAYAVWVGCAVRRDALQLAWARLQHAWTIASILFIHGLLLFEGRVLYGYWLTLVGQACMVLAVELARYRMKHDLWNATEPVTRPQFSIRRILGWTAFFPILVSYYRAVELLLNYWFGP
jgi:hypothetical protein